MNAVCTIIVVASSDPFYGLPRACWRLRVPQPNAVIARHMFLSIRRDPTYLLKGLKWMTRAWVYQEAIFSIRKLIFTDQELYFKCDSLRCCEAVDMHPELLESERRAGDVHQYMFTALRRFGSNIINHIENYSKRELTYSEDTLNALSGIFQALEKLPNPSYQIQGVPIPENPRHSMT